ncbi:MAG: ATP-binding cassette domain-containing protein [Planctomycetes bacterium]|nr:ATP-binding cassette domain-containing protein [Planctomycetota bacterium]
MINVKGISKYYGTLKALDGVSFEAAKGEVLGFLGPNGAGKSTTLKILTTYISASEGTATVAGFDVHAQPAEVRRRLGYLPESPPLYTDMQVDEYLAFVGSARGLSGATLRDRLASVVEETGLRRKLRARIAELSKGYKQRVGIAQAMIHDPEVLVLDEPTSGLDPMQIVEIRKLMERLREKKCIIFSTHILQEATAVASRLVVINNGRKVADGTAEQLASQAGGVHAIKLLLRGDCGGLEALLRAVPGVVNVERQNPPQGYARFLLRAEGGQSGALQACEQISTLAARRALVIAELAPQRLTLEEIFFELLRQGGTPPAQSADKPQPPGAPTEKVAPPAASEQSTNKPTEPVEPALPDDPNATAAATRITHRPTEADNYSEVRSAPSETAYEGVRGEQAGESRKEGA